jgi:hypothetical protein
MPTLFEIVVLAIGLLATTAIALLLAPTFVWVRRRLSRREAPERELRAEGMLDPKAIAGDVAVRAGAVAPVDPE